METVNWKVEGMSCSACAQTINGFLEKKGMKDVRVSLTAGEAQFQNVPGLPEQEYHQAAFIQFVEDIRRRQFDLVLQMQGNGAIVNELLPLFAAKHVAGFCNKESYVPHGHFLHYPNHGSEASRHIKLMELLGIPSQGDALESPPAVRRHGHAATGAGRLRGRLQRADAAVPPGQLHRRHDQERDLVLQRVRPRGRS